MKNIRRNYHFLNALRCVSSTQRKALLKNATPDQIKAICEICDNTLKGNLPVNVNKIKKYKCAIRKLADKKIGLKAKKKILVNQSGGFLQYLIKPLISFVGGLIGKAIGQ